MDSYISLINDTTHPKILTLHIEEGTSEPKRRGFIDYYSTRYPVVLRMQASRGENRKAKGLFGPSRNHNSLSPSSNSNNYGGLGYASLGGASSDSFVRGGSYKDGIKAGIFAVRPMSSDDVADDVGFRCVYHPYHEKGLGIHRFEF